MNMHPDSFCLASLNKDVLHQTIANLGTWDREVRDCTTSSWLDNLVATDDLELRKKVRQSPSREMLDCLARLDGPTQQFVQRLVATAQSNSELVEILARLAERLQQRITELESPCSHQQSPTSP